MIWRPNATAATLRLRAERLERLRRFFADRGILEVDPPIIQAAANLDPGIAPLPCAGRWLITSPEHHLKRLLAAGVGDCWTLCPVARAGELGRWHNPEFRMLEWYRLGLDDRQLATETIALLRTLTDLDDRCRILDYEQAFQETCGWSPSSVADDTLAAAAASAGLEGHSGERQDLLDLLLATVVQPAFDRDAWTVLVDWPAAQAAQARLRTDLAGRSVAARFEIYRGGLELANGYWECSDPQELRARQAAQADREGLPADQRLYAALEAGLPDCAGVAVGFDRVIALAAGATDLASVLPFAWDRA